MEDVKSTTAAAAPLLRLNSQALTDFAEQEWAGTHAASPLSALFQGQTLHISSCSACDFTDPSFADVFVTDQLHLAPVAQLSSVKLEKLLADASRAETMDEYECDRCSAAGTTEFASGHVRLPEVYVVRLNRGHFLPDGRSSRVSTSVHFPDRLDLRRHGRMCTAVADAQSQEYELFGAVFHAGATPNGGHYYSYVRRSSDEEWMQLNDCRVSRRGSPQEEEERGSCGGFGARAMLLFYRRADGCGCD